MTERSRRTLVRAVRALAVLACLLLLAQVLYADRALAAEVIRRRPAWLWVAVGACCQLANQVLAMIRWYLLVQAIEIPLGFPKAMELGVLAECGHAIMPGANGGDLLKMGAILRMQVPRTQLLASTAVDRLSGLMGLLLVGSAAAAAGWASAGPDARRLSIGLWATAATAALVGVAALQPPALRLLGRAGRRLPLPKLREIVEQLEAAAHAYRRRWPWLGAAVLFSCVSQTLSQLAFYLAGLAMFRDAMSPVRETLLITPILFVSSAIPLPFGALGVSEQIGERLFRSLGQEGGGLNMLAYRLIHGIAIAAMALGYGAAWAGRRLAARYLGRREPHSLAANPAVEEGPVEAGIEVVD